MKVAMLAEASNPHVNRWCCWLARKGVEVVLMSDRPPGRGLEYPGVRVRCPEWPLWRQVVTFKFRGGKYANNRDKWAVYKPLIEEEKPDVLHAQEAIAYGPILPRFPEYARVLTPWGMEMENLEERGFPRSIFRELAS